MQNAGVLSTTSSAIIKEVKTTATVPLTTPSGADNPFHALLGRWQASSQEVVCDDVGGQRAALRQAVAEVKSGSELYKLIASGIQELLTAGRRIGAQSQQLYEKHQKFLSTRSEPALWQAFEQSLKQHPSMLAYIQEHHNLSGSPSLEAQFHSALTQSAGGLYKQLLQSPRLHQAFKHYTEARDKGFNWQVLTAPMLKEYSEYLASSHSDTLPSEVAILAHHFNVQLIYYAGSDAAAQRINFGPRRSGTVSVQFKQVDHYERCVTREEASKLGIGLTEATLPEKKLTAKVAMQNLGSTTPEFLTTTPVVQPSTNPPRVPTPELKLPLAAEENEEKTEENDEEFEEFATVDPETEQKEREAREAKAAAKDKAMTEACFARVASTTSVLPVGSITISKQLGKGAFGKVFEGVWEGRKVALKEIALEHARDSFTNKDTGKQEISDDDLLESFEYEVARLATLSHPNLVEFYGVYRQGEQFFLVMEMCAGGSLRKALDDKAKTFSTAQRWQMAFEMVQGLAYLHAQGVVHRDLKADNVLLTATGHAKLADLGTAQVDAILGKEAAVVRQGLSDAKFKAPEDFFNDSVGSGPASDIFAYGLILWELVSRQSVKELTVDKLRERLRDTGEREPIPKNCPPLFTKIMRQCWRFQASRRPSAAELCTQLTERAGDYHPHAAAALLWQTNQILLHPQRSALDRYQAPFALTNALDEKTTADRFWVEQEQKPSATLKTVAEEIDAFINDKNDRVLALIGDGGVGKSLSSYVELNKRQQSSAVILDRAAAGDAKVAAIIPPLVLLLRPAIREWKHSGLNQAIERALDSDVYPLASHRAALQQQALLLILDGWDELQADQAPQNITKQLQLAQWPHAKLIITTRAHAIPRGQLMQLLGYQNQARVRYLLPFSTAQLNRYLEQHLVGYPEQRQTLQKIIQNTPPLRSQLRNPLALSVLSHTWTRLQAHNLHQLTRYQLYELSIRHWLESNQNLLSQAILAQLIGTQAHLTASFLHMAGQLASLGLVQQRPALVREQAIHQLSDGSARSWLRLDTEVTREAREEFSTREDQMEPAQLHRAILGTTDYVRFKLQSLQRFLQQCPLMLISYYCDYHHRAFYEFLMTHALITALDEKDIERVAGQAPALQHEPQVLALLQEQYAAQPVAKQQVWTTTLLTAQAAVEAKAQETQAPALIQAAPTSAAIIEVKAPTVSVTPDPKGESAASAGTQQPAIPSPPTAFTALLAACTALPSPVSAAPEPTRLSSSEAASTIQSAVRILIARKRVEGLRVQKDCGILLSYIVEGDQKAAEELLKARPELALMSGTVKDPGGRTFHQITALQYAVWGLDWMMWEMLIKYIPQDEAARQLRAWDEAKSYEHGHHFDLSRLLNALNTYMNNYDDWSGEHCQQHWVFEVGVAQRELPVSVVHEYCMPGRSFDPVPNFAEAGGARSRLVELDNGKEWVCEYDWYHGHSAAYMQVIGGVISGEALGTGYGVYRSHYAQPTAPYRIFSLSGLGGLFSPYINTDRMALRQYVETREAQAAALRTQLKLTGTPRP